MDDMKPEYKENLQSALEKNFTNRLRDTLLCQIFFKDTIFGK